MGSRSGAVVVKRYSQEETRRADAPWCYTISMNWLLETQAGRNCLHDNEVSKDGCHETSCYKHFAILLLLSVRLASLRSTLCGTRGGGIWEIGSLYVSESHQAVGNTRIHQWSGITGHWCSQSLLLLCLPQRRMRTKRSHDNLGKVVP